MTLATLTTQAPAARKRGGGLARRYLLASLLMGRPAMPTGGETKSLCRAAAGITSALPRDCESFAYPMIGVRQARELSKPLRALTPLAAQLVKEGKSLLPEYLHEHCKVSVQQLCFLNCVSNHPPFSQLPCERGAPTQIEYHLKQRRDQLGIRHISNFDFPGTPPLRIKLFCQEPIARRWTGIRTFYISQQHLRRGLAPSSNFVKCTPDNHNPLSLSFQCGPIVVVSGMQCRPCSYGNCTDAADSLNPAFHIGGKPAVLNPVCDRADEQPCKGCANYQPPQCPKRPNRHSWGKFEFQPTHLVSLLTNRSLHAAAPLVHGRAA